MTLQEAVNRSKDEEEKFPDVINSDAGLQAVPELNTIGIPTWNRIRKDRKRKIVLEIRSWKGMSWNAIHYYGKLIVDGVYTGKMDDPDECTNLSHEDEIKYPLFKYHYYFKIKKPLTKQEIESNPKRWEFYYKEGDLIEGFETSEELIADTKKIIKLRFTGDWDYFIQFPNGKKVTLTL